METTAVPCLPEPPDIMRAQCPEARPINYLSDYLWKISQELGRFAPWIFYDMRYGFCLFPDKTLDCGEMKYDASNFTMNICGTNYTHGYEYYTTIVRDEIDPEYVKRLGEDPDLCATSWDNYTSNPTYSADVFPLVEMVQLRQFELGGHKARAYKYYLNFDTSTADASPTSAILRLQISSFEKTVGLADPTLRVYSQDWGDLVDTGDWGGGVLRDSQVISGTGRVDLDVDTASVNIGGDTKYKLSFKEIDDVTNLGCSEILTMWISHVSYEKERLILGYNE